MEQAPSAQPNGQQSEPTVEDLVRDATVAVKQMMEAFTRTAEIAGWNRANISPAGYSFVMQLIMMNAQNSFYGAVIELLGEIVVRTRAADGGLDPRAIQREMARRNVAVAMGPDPEVLQHLVMGGNHAQQVQDQELAKLRGQLENVRDWLQVWIDGEVDSPRDLIQSAKELLGYLTPPAQDPGSIPENVRMDGGMGPQP